MNLEVVVEASTGHRHVAHMLAQGPLSVGRGEECDVQLDDNHISRRHVLLTAQPGVLRVQDISTNGTLAGDQLLRGGSVDVAYGTPILLGFHTIYVRNLESGARNSAAPDEPAIVNQTVVLAPVVPLHPVAKTEPAPAAAPSISLVPPLAPAAPRVEGALALPEADGPLRREIHRRLLEHLDLAMTETSRLDDPSFRPRVLTALRRIVKLLEDRIPAGVDRDRLVGEMADEALGLGPLEHLLSDPAVSEIMVIDADTIYVERAGKITKSVQHFTDEERVRAVIERIVTPLGRRIDESSPLVDARLPDGSRVNAIIKPLALKGSCITIRKFPKSALDLKRLYELSALSPAMGTFLTRSVIAKKNIVISGGTGSGKTTLLNVLSAFIPNDERIVTIEDSAELRLEQPHVVSLETRPPNMEGKGQYTIRDLVKNALRMRPDRIVVGECRGGEALDMLQAMNTGHDGSLTTTHANSPAEALARLETLCLMAGVELPSRAIREQIASSIQLIVQQTRLSDGTRKVVAISEVCGLDQRGDFELRRIYGFDRQGTGPNGEVLGNFLASGYLPSFLDELIVRGLIKPGERYL
ncbi:MAG: Type secretion system hydrolase TadA/VirB11/CpaF, TadA subfamily [Polyangiaceae bacterium]|jgi:pilus assembly protein CpaF|nr:Type secretion system hydrolase TadA/VirB11/CpaF, TadA subfamily [Polyangiaceae bacterium]